MSVQPVTEQTFEREVLLEQLPVLVEFGAEWCGPCKMLAPEMAALSQELAGKAKIVSIDIDQNPMLAQQLGVRSVPTFVVFHEGRPVTGKVGALRKPQLKELLEPLLPKAAGALPVPEAARLAQAGQITLVDTREPAVYARAHIEGAVNIPAEEIQTRLAELHMLAAQPVLYCRTGERTKELAAKLAADGIPVAFLEGGVLAWEGEGHELHRPD